MLFILFHAFMIFWFGSVSTCDRISGKLEYRLFLCPVLAAEFFYRRGTDAYQILRQDAPSRIAILELIMDCLLNHCLKTPKCASVYLCLSEALVIYASAASQAVCEHQASSTGASQATVAASQGWV